MRYIHNNKEFSKQELIQELVNCGEAYDYIEYASSEFDGVQWATAVQENRVQEFIQATHEEYDKYIDGQIADLVDNGYIELVDGEEHDYEIVVQMTVRTFVKAKSSLEVADKYADYTLDEIFDNDGEIDDEQIMTITRVE